MEETLAEVEEVVETTEAVIEQIVQVVDLQPLVTLVTEQNAILKQQYTATLFVIGVLAAVGVSLLLYHFIKSFY